MAGTGTPMSTGSTSTLGSIAGDDPFSSAGKSTPSLSDLASQVAALTVRVTALEGDEKDELGQEPEAEDAIANQDIPK